MKLQKNLTLFNDDTISLSYISEKFNAGDTPLVIYNKHKISILLSDGLNAVKSDKIIYAKKNSVLFFRSDELHFGRIFRSGIHVYLEILLPLSLEEHFHYSEAIDFLNDKSENRINCITFDLEHQKQISKLASAIVNIMQNEDKKSDIRLFSLILRILLLCGDFYEMEKANPSDSGIPAFIQKTMLFISRNFEKPLSLDMLASNVNCSVTYLSRVFKKHTGMTVYNYITSIRIAHAQMMLNAGSSVIDACFSSGFNDCSNFIQKFKKATGKTPMQFKNAMQA